MRITRSQLSRIIREEARQLRTEASGDFAAHGGQLFKLLEQIDDLAGTMGVDPAEVCEKLVEIVRERDQRAARRG